MLLDVLRDNHSLIRESASRKKQINKHRDRKCNTGSADRGLFYLPSLKIEMIILAHTLYVCTLTALSTAEHSLSVHSPR